MSSGHIITSYLSAEVLLHRLVLLHFAGVPENEGQLNISVNSNATHISACVYMWTAVMIRRESGRNRKLYSQTSLLCFVVCAEFACPAKCAELCRRKSRLMKEIVAKLK